MGWLAVPATFGVGLLIGRLATRRKGMVISAVAGAIVYTLGLTVLAGSPMTFQFSALDLPLQILIVTLGAESSLLGWYLGAKLRPTTRLKKAPRKRSGT